MAQCSASVRDVYVCGLDHVENLGNGCSRYVMFTIERMPDGTYSRRMVKPAIIMPNDSVPDAVLKTSLAQSIVLMAGQVWPMLH